MTASPTPSSAKAKIHVTGHGQLAVHILTGKRVRAVGRLKCQGATYQIDINIDKNQDAWVVADYGRMVRRLGDGRMYPATLSATRAMFLAIRRAVERLETRSAELFVAAERAQLVRKTDAAQVEIEAAHVLLEERILSRQRALQELARFDRRTATDASAQAA